MTYPRLLDLVELHERTTRRELYDLGSVIALGFNEPSGLKDLLKPPTNWNPENIPAMLRAPKKVTDV